MANELSIFEKVIRAEEHVQEWERRERKRLANKADWKDPVARKEYVRRLKQERRQKLLDRVVPKRVCPHCGEVKLKSSSWVILFPTRARKTQYVGCRFCYNKMLKARKENDA